MGLIVYRTWEGDDPDIPSRGCTILLTKLKNYAPLNKKEEGTLHERVFNQFNP